MNDKCELPDPTDSLPRPDFLILGAEKAGTTWLADMLRQHPGIYIPPQKELFYFNKQFFESPELHNYNHDQPLSWYLSHFQDAQPDQRIGEASPAYLWDEAAPLAIHRFQPKIQLIAVLRDPVQRAFSQYLYFLQRGYFSRVSFEEALKKRSDLLTRGMYAQQLDRYRALFPQAQIYIGFFDDLQRDGVSFLTAVQRFIGVAPWVPDDIDRRSNITGQPRFPWINRAIAWVRYPIRKYNPDLLMRALRASGLARVQERIRLANTRPFEQRPVIDPAIERELRAFFQEDIVRLEAITGRDLRSWKTRAANPTTTVPLA